MATPPTNFPPQGPPKAARFGVGHPLLIAVILLFVSLIVGLLFPAIKIAREQARKTAAKCTCAEITAAIKAYYAEYGKYPLGAHEDSSGQISGDFIFGQSPNSPSVGSGVSNAELFDILRNIDASRAQPSGHPTRYNPKGIIFFDGKDSTDPVDPCAGFVPPGAKAPAHPGALVDPWGTEYFIAIDADYNSRLTNLPYEDFQGDNAPYIGVGVFSLGKDRRLGTNGDGFYKNPSTSAPSDDVISWR